jgi:hypothetical protein
MAHSFNAKLNIKGELSSQLDKVKKSITGQGGSFDGDAKAGKFTVKTPLGNVSLSYTVLPDNQLAFKVTDKPMLVPNSTIESKIREFLA